MANPVGQVWGNDHLVGELLPFLDATSLGRAECVCVAWRRLSTDLALWSRLCLATPRCVVGPASQGLHDSVGSKRYIQLVMSRRRHHLLRRHDLRALVDSDLWTRLVADDKWLVRLHIAFAMDTVLPHMEGSDAAHVLGAFSEVLDDAFGEFGVARELLLLALVCDEAAWITHHLALLAEKQQDYDQAEHWFQRGYDLDHTYVPNALNFAVFMEERRLRYDEAEELYAHALQHAATPRHSLDVYFAMADFYLLKRRDIPRTHAVLAQAYHSLKAITNVDAVCGRDVQVAIQYAEFLVYVCHDFPTAATVFKVLLQRWTFEQSRKGKVQSDVATFLQIGLLSYGIYVYIYLIVSIISTSIRYVAICVVFSTSNRVMALRLVDQAAAVEQCVANLLPDLVQTTAQRVVKRYKLTAAAVVQHTPDLCRPVTCKQDFDSLAPLMGLLYYLNGDTDAAMALWAAYIRRLANIHSPEYAFAGCVHSNLVYS
ncbi:hypothetical protein, variant 2 [Aphanomyces astaci]|uniref:F-box domain-containing protein n=1 Tax=Aphanomyces astaci TaxID=112090 RepID=W4G542_APHAT|nr:hypothetical protein, variant 2 [Aphanomyces astaci]ETV74842.1 hypothetical protein, variant 2 [Aphanomyces astaci]|eukprot:XP_009835929.1 hypothetical protein, variant 2 [Aphanomyces astaci]